MGMLLTEEKVAALSAPITLPCGKVLHNRLVKAAMEEFLGGLGGGDPTPLHDRLYQEWSRGQWGMLLTGNVMVSSQHLGMPFDIVLPSSPSTSKAFTRSISSFRSWASSSKKTDSPSAKSPLVIMQLCHPGRQSARGFGRSPFQPALAPSAVALNGMGDSLLGKALSWVVWGVPRAMTEEDIEEVTNQFVGGALLAQEAGFDGIELHASHGYLLAEFMSPNVNLRTDSYGGTGHKRAALMFKIIDAVRDRCPQSSGFCIGVKLNSSDYVKGGLTEADALDTIKLIAEHGGVDFIEISGGTYENPKFLGEDISASTSRREAFFQAFSASAHALLRALPSSSLPSPRPLVMLTGGFRSRSGMVSALLPLSSPTTDLVGLARAACLNPSLPLTLLDKNISEEDARSITYTIRGRKWMEWTGIGLIGPGVETLHYAMLLALVARGRKVDTEMSLPEGVWKMVVRPLFLHNPWWTSLGLGLVLISLMYML